MKNLKDLISQNREVYNTIASYFSDTRSFLWDELKPLAKYTKDGDRVLDIGCGNGRLYQLFEKNQVSYTGVDQSSELIKIAQEKYPEGQFVVSEMRELPFEDSSFDVVYAIASFHHLPDEESRIKALEEMKRVLKPGSYIVMTNWNLHSRSTSKNIEKGKWRVEEGTYEFTVPWLSPEGEVLGQRYYHGFDLEELEDLFAKAGLELEEQYYVDKKGRSDQEEGKNIISIIKRP